MLKINFEHISHHFSSVSAIGFKQLIAYWDGCTYSGLTKIIDGYFCHWYSVWSACKYTPHQRLKILIIYETKTML